MFFSLPSWLQGIVMEERIDIEGFVLMDKKLLKKEPWSFDLEWQQHVDEQMTTTWGWTAKSRLEQFFIETETNHMDLQNSLILDAGCGNGQLTQAIASCGAHVLGMDKIGNLSQVLNHLETKANHLYFLNADILDPPIKAESFDLVISNGVLHHTQDTKKAFLKIASLVKEGGKLYVWLYRKPFQLKNKILLFFLDTARLIISRLPQGLQRSIIKALTRLFSNITKIRNGRNATKSYTDLLIEMYDSFTPLYRHYHHPIELAGWFYEAGFGSPVLSHWDNSYGFGMVAEKKSGVKSAGENFEKAKRNENIHLT